MKLIIPQVIGKINNWLVFCLGNLHLLTCSDSITRHLECHIEGAVVLGPPHLTLAKVYDHTPGPLMKPSQGLSAAAAQSKRSLARRCTLNGAW